MELAVCESDDEIKSYVDRLFREAPDRRWETRTNPVTGTRWVSGLDPIAPQKKAACRAVRARNWFARTAPSDAPPLPLCYGDRERLKYGGGLPRIVAWFARSLEALKYDFDRHPPFEEYACGVMASRYAPRLIKENAELRKRFPPGILDGLGSCLYWDPPKLPS
jgi:hypothetical protein